MKKSVLKIGRVFLILGLFCISFNGNSQDLKLSKKEQKEVRKAERLKEYEALGTLLESRKFVFEATTKQNEEGLIVTINPSSNYIKIDSSRITLKLETSGGEWAPNVSLYFDAQIMGGVITDWELLKNPKKLTYSLILRSHLENPHPGGFNFTIRVYANKSAQVRFNRGRKSDFSEFFGYLKAL